jgi:hypothetical protein
MAKIAIVVKTGLYTAKGVPNVFTQWQIGCAQSIVLFYLGNLLFCDVLQAGGASLGLCKYAK